MIKVLNCLVRILFKILYFKVGNPDVLPRSGEPTATGEHAADPRLPRPGVRRARGHLPARSTLRKPAKKCTYIQ